MKKTLSIMLLVGAMTFAAVPALAQSEAAATTEATDDDGSNNGLWGLLGLPGLLGLIGRRRNDDTARPRTAGASRATLAVLALSSVLVLGTATGVLAQSDEASDAGAAVEEVEGDSDQGIDGRWGLLGLLGLFGLLGYRNDKDRDRYDTTTPRPGGSTQAR